MERYELKYGSTIEDSKRIGRFKTQEECFEKIGELKPDAPYLRWWGGYITTVDYGMHNMFFYILDLDVYYYD